MSLKRWTAAALAAWLASGAGPAAAQRVVAGFPRVNQSDITGPSVTSSDLVSFEPGTVQSMECPAAWGLLDQGRTVGHELDSLRLAGYGAGAGRTLSATAQRDVAVLLYGGSGADAAGARVLAALTAGNPGAGAAAEQLVGAARGLLATVARLDPVNPGRAAPTRLHRAVGAWDELVDASSPAYLAAPPDEFAALGAVLGRLNAAALAHALRAGDPRQVDAYGSGCAPPPLPVPPPAEEPILDFAACVLSGGDFRMVTGIFHPARGDSLVDVDGARRAFRDAYPDSAGYAAGAPWFGRDTVLTAFGRRYVQWGMSRVVRPGELAPAGSTHGVTVFVLPGGPTPPEVVYLPFRPGCEVQPYRRVEEARKVRGG